MNSTPLRRPYIFIASSSEALPVAEAVKRHFAAEAYVDIWNENIFAINRSYLTTLLNRASYYDYVIAIFTPDDEAIIRDKAVRVTRDNVIFEFGLFLGRLGPPRTFLLAQEGVELFSDWSGISTEQFSGGGDLYAAVERGCNTIRREIENAKGTYTMLPSTSLAIGYYYNFLSRVFDAFQNSSVLYIGERDDRGHVKPHTEHPIRDAFPTIHVKLPPRLRDLTPNVLKKRTAHYKEISVRSTFRSYPFYISGDIDADDGSVELFDIPTTMLSAKYAIERLFSEDFLASDDTRSHLESREIDNFQQTLRILVPDELEHRYFDFSLLTDTD